MTLDPNAKKPSKSYNAGDTVTTKLTLAPGHAVPQTVIGYFARVEPATPYDPNRAYSFPVRADNINTAGTSGPTGGQPLVVTLSGVIPHHVVGGTYKPNGVTFYFSDGQPLSETNPDPDGDLVIAVADDPATAASKPVIQDFDLA